MRILLMAALLCGGCSWLFQDHLHAEYSGKSEPVCDTSNGFASVDTVLAILNLAGAIAAAADSGGMNNDDVVAGGIVDGLIFGVSAITGFGWAGQCRKAREEWDDRSERQDRADEARAARDEAKRYDAEKKRRERDADKERPEHVGETPLFCGPGDEATRVCFLTNEQCQDMHAAGVACEPLDAGACFATIKALTGEKSERCAASIKTCEERRATTSSDPDYRDTIERCWIYRRKPADRLQPPESDVDH